MRYIILVIVLTLATSCVSTQRYNSMRAEALQYQNDMDTWRSRTNELDRRNKVLSSQLEELKADTTHLGETSRELQNRYNDLLSRGSAEATRMLKQIEQTQRDLEQHSMRVDELQKLLKEREDALGELRRRVTDALVAFTGEELNVSIKNGMVYVSMEDKLLFKSGSFDVDPKGEQAIKELAQVLATNPDITILVEGHTDNVPYKGKGNLKDNLDLSAKRATTVARLMIESANITPERVVAAGRGESLPIALGDDSESRAKNRRTEIILSPNLDELLSLMKN